MRVFIVPAARDQISVIHGQRREHRTAAPNLFAEELAGAIALIASSPRIGRRRRRPGVPGLRRVLLRASRYHVYYAPSSTDDRLFVLAVWAAVRRTAPPLGPIT